MIHRNNNHHCCCCRLLVLVVGTLLAVVVVVNAILPSLPSNYESFSASKKQAELWSLVQSAEGTESRYPTVLGLAKFLTENLDPTVDHYGDDLPYRNRHNKRIHSVGAVAKTKFVITNPNHPYTGQFQTGSNYGVARLSLSTNYIYGVASPGIAVKFLRTNIPSGNYVAMYSLAGQGADGNFFKNNFSNHVPVPSNINIFQKTLLNNFRRTSTEPSRVGLSDIASYYENGTSIDQELSSNFPYKLILVPNPTLTESFRNINNAKELKVALTSRIPSNTVLYEIYATDSPTNETQTLIGELITTSKVIYSKLGDDFLFFRHQAFEDDLKLRPSWKEEKQQQSNRKYFRRSHRQLLEEDFHKVMSATHSNVSAAIENFMFPCAFAHQYFNDKE